jgi:hypothetical protein
LKCRGLACTPRSAHIAVSPNCIVIK